MPKSHLDRALPRNSSPNDAWLQARDNSRHWRSSSRRLENSGPIGSHATGDESSGRARISRWNSRLSCQASAMKDRRVVPQVVLARSAECSTLRQRALLAVADSCHRERTVDRLYARPLSGASGRGCVSGTARKSGLHAMGSTRATSRSIPTRSLDCTTRHRSMILACRCPPRNCTPTSCRSSPSGTPGDLLPTGRSGYPNRSLCHCRNPDSEPEQLPAPSDPVGDSACHL